MWVQFPSWCKGSVPSSHARGLGFKPHWRKYSFHFMDIEQPSLYCACFVENCQPGPNKRENRNVGTVIKLFVSYLFVLALQPRISKVFLDHMNSFSHEFVTPTATEVEVILYFNVNKR